METYGHDKSEDGVGIMKRHWIQAIIAAILMGKPSGYKNTVPTLNEAIALARVLLAEASEDE